jgi:hypothetical protein
MSIDTIGRVYWLMPWKSKYGKTDREDEMIFNEERALAHLLLNDVIFLNDHWWENQWPEKAKKISSLNVNCNDVFAWGCSDAEEMPHAELQKLYDMWLKDPEWGAAVWCMVQRNQMPQKPVEDRIRKAGIWDLDALGIEPNTMDAEILAAFGANNKAVLSVRADTVTAVPNSQ